MAVLHSSSSPVKAVSSKSTQESLKRAHGGDNEREFKRVKCPGVRFKGNHIYDSLNGSTCHQCRQKTRDFAALCKNQKGSKVCPIKFCHKCLLNRYGEKAEEVRLSSDWKCPKCRDICNCSFCMKKKGCKPTGQLAITAKASGFSSVHAMLKGKDSEGTYVNQINGCNGQIPGKIDAVSSMQPIATAKEQLVSPLVNQKKENFLHRKGDLSSSSPKTKVNSMEKVKRVELKGSRCGTNADEPYLTISSAKKSKDEKVREEADRNENDSTVAEKNKKLVASTKSDMRSAAKLGFDKNVSVSLTKEFGASHVGKRRKEASLCGKDDPIQKENVPAEPNDVSSKEIISNAAVSHKRPVPPNREHGIHHVGKQRKDISVGAKNDPTQKKEAPEEPNGVSCREIFKDKDVSHKRPAHACKELRINQVRMLKEEDSSGVKSGLTWKEVSEDSYLSAMTKDVKGEMDEPEKVNTLTTGSDMKQFRIDVPLPLGLPLTDISGFKLLPEDMGDALQLLEFCAVFGKALNLRKGEAEAVLRELMRTRAGRLAQSSFATSVVQFHVKFISIILKDKGEMSRSLNTNNGRDAWVKALNNLISGSDFDLSQLQLDTLDKVIDYHNLDFAKKLRLLNFLCDEALATKKLRNWINDQNMKFVEQEKKERSVVQAARCEEKHLKQKMLDEVAVAMLSKNAPLSIEEHDALVSKIKVEVARAHAQLLDAKFKLSNRSQISDAIRTEPVFSDAHGRRFWKLKYYGDEDAILLQDMRESVERWSSYGAEQKSNIEQYFSSSRLNGQRTHGVPHPFPVEISPTDV